MLSAAAQSIRSSGGGNEPVLVIRDGRMFEGETGTLYEQAFEGPTTVIEYRKRLNPAVLAGQGLLRHRAPRPRSQHHVHSTMPPKRQNSLPSVVKVTWKPSWNHAMFSPTNLADALVGLSLTLASACTPKNQHRFTGPTGSPASHPMTCASQETKQLSSRTHGSRQFRHTVRVFRCGRRFALLAWGFWLDGIEGLSRRSRLRAPLRALDQWSYAVSLGHRWVGCSPPLEPKLAITDLHDLVTTWSTYQAPSAVRPCSPNRAGILIAVTGVMTTEKSQLDCAQ